MILSVFNGGLLSSELPVLLLLFLLLLNFL